MTMIISLVVSITALCLTIGQLIVHNIKSRMNFEIEIENIGFFEYPERNEYTVTIMILNNSSKQLNITRVYLKSDSGYIASRIKKVWIGDEYYPVFPETDIPRTERKFSDELPLSIYPYGAKLVTLKFVGTKEDKKIEINEFVELQISTNRKEKITKKEKCKADIATNIL